MSKRASAGAPSGGGAKKSRKDYGGSEHDLPDPQVMSRKAKATTGRVKIAAWRLWTFCMRMRSGFKESAKTKTLLVNCKIWVEYSLLC